MFSLISVGLTLTFGVMKIKNFAHGDFLIVGMYFAFLLHADRHNPYIAALIGVPLFFGIGWILQKFLIRPVLEAPRPSKS